MALAKQEIWDLIAPLVEAEGLVLFDLIPSPGGFGSMQVFISSPYAAAKPNGEESAKGGVSVEDCARISRRILDMERIEEILPGAAELQVSSPGVNRKLSRPEHFSAAVGERLKVTLHDENGAKRSVRGFLQKFDGTSLWLLLDKSEKASTEQMCVELSQIDAARVDFVF